VKHAAVLVLALFLAACGSSSGSKPASEAKNGPIVFAQISSSADGIYKRDPAGHVTRLTKGRDAFPAWSPDGKQIAFSRLFDFKNGGSHIYVMRADGSELHQIGKLVNYGEVVSWSPDADQIAFLGKNGIEVAGVDGSGEKTVAVKGMEPAWAPDGETILFRKPPVELWVVRPDGTDLHRLLKLKQPRNQAHLLMPLYPAWSADGGHILFARIDLYSFGLDKPAGDIVVADADGSGARSVTKLFISRGEGARPSWSPDGRFIAYFDLRPGIEDGIFVVPSGGGRPRQLLDSTSSSAPSWGPAGA
jgi:Tol biopolymer transport system component